MFGELESRVDLSIGQRLLERVPCSGRTSYKSTSGGPSAMSSALVPGRILRAALWSRVLNSFCCSGLAAIGDNWSSGIGGGLGRRGEAGDAIS